MRVTAGRGGILLGADVEERKVRRVADTEIVFAEQSVQRERRAYLLNVDYQMVQFHGIVPRSEYTQIISGDYGHPTSRDHTLNMCYSVYPNFTLLQENENHQCKHAHRPLNSGKA